MNKWLPKEERKKIVLLADDLRMHSGIGVQSREIVEQTCGYYNWFQLGASVSHPNAGQVHDISVDLGKQTGVKDPDVKILGWNGYGDPRILRQIISQEKPDAILHFTDPRYWIWFYEMENEIRQHIPILYYNIWDDLPYPFYNRNYYRSCDGLFSISKQTYNINKQVLGEENIRVAKPSYFPRKKKGKSKLKNEFVFGNPITERTDDPKSYIAYIPHGIDTNKFFPIEETDEENTKLLKESKEKIFRGEEVDFVVFYNARNIRRKMVSDILLAYDYFLKKISPEEAEKCRILLHTQPVDDGGTDLPRVIQDVVPNIKVVFSQEKLDASRLNTFYNLADVSINLASNEGFGLGTCESIITGTPIIVNVTGGLQDQCGFVNKNGDYIDPELDLNYEFGTNHNKVLDTHGEWAFPVWPVGINLQGSPLTPYIFDDRADWREAGERILEVYNLSKEERQRRGMLGREYALNEGMFTAEKMGTSFIEHIDEVMNTFEPRKRYYLRKI